MRFVLHLLTAMRALSADRNRLAMENVVLRHQLNVLKRGVKQVQLEDSDRAFWVLIHRLPQEGLVREEKLGAGIHAT